MLHFCAHGKHLPEPDVHLDQFTAHRCVQADADSIRQSFEHDSVLFPAVASLWPQTLTVRCGIKGICFRWGSSSKLAALRRTYCKLLKKPIRLMKVFFFFFCLVWKSILVVFLHQWKVFEGTAFMSRFKSFVKSWEK